MFVPKGTLKWSGPNSSFYKWRHWFSGNWSVIPQTTQSASDRTEIKLELRHSAPLVCFPTLCNFPCNCSQYNWNLQYLGLRQACNWPHNRGKSVMSNAKPLTYQIRLFFILGRRKKTEIFGLRTSKYHEKHLLTLISTHKIFKAWKSHKTQGLVFQNFPGNERPLDPCPEKEWDNSEQKVSFLPSQECPNEIKCFISPFKSVTLWEKGLEAFLFSNTQSLT